MNKTVILFLAAIMILTSCTSGDNLSGNIETQSADSMEVSENTDITSNIETEAYETPSYISTESGIEDTGKDSLVCDFRDVNSEFAFCYDTASGDIASKGDMDERIYPASITKLWTAHVVLEHLDPDTVITAGEELELVKPGSSIAFIRKGHRLTVEMLIEAMLLPSGNDAAYILARAVGETLSSDDLSANDYVMLFVDLMNDLAKENRLCGTKFTNPDGYHDFEHYSTMIDLLKISEIALRSELIKKYARINRDRVYFESGQNIEWKNTNLLLDPTSLYYRDNAIGLKTGYTDQAGYCLVSAFELDGREIIVGVFRCSNSDMRFEDTCKIFDSFLIQ